jgi:hypothetical protein
MPNGEQTGSRKRGQMNKQREARRRPRGGTTQQSRAVGQRERTERGNRRREEESLSNINPMKRKSSKPGQGQEEEETQ